MPQVARTVHPMEYDKNATRNTARFTRGFNNWAVYIRASVEEIGDRPGKEVDQILNGEEK